MKTPRFIRFLCLMLVLLMLCEMVPVSSRAASVSFYQTSTTNVPIWSSASSKSTKIRTIGTKGTVLRVTGSTKNNAGNLWYQLSDGCWVWSGNVSKHSHSYTGGICNGLSCNYEWPYAVSSASGIFVVTASGGAKIWTRPYSNKSTNVSIFGYGTALTVVGKTTNQDGNLWYKLSSGYWVWSGSVTQQFTVAYNANGGSGAPGTQTVFAGSTLTIPSTKPTRANYIFQGWATSAGSSSVSYKPGSSYKFASNQTLYAVWKACSHKEYDSGYCKTCGKEYALRISSYSSERLFIVTKADGTPVYNRPYSTRSTKVRTEKGGAMLRINAKTVNAADNTWYRLTDGNWVWSGNLTEHTHSYKGGICTEPACGHEWKYTITAISGTYAVTAADGAKIWTRPYSNNSTTVRRAAYGTALTVVGKTTNQDGNLWYQLSDGTWVWSGSVARQFTVTFNDNGGTGGPGTQTVFSGKELTISSRKPTRNGYAFQGWATSAGSSTVSYKAGKSYKFTSDKTLYAVWKACSHKEYSSGYCKSCGKEYALKISPYSSERLYAVTESDGAPVYNRPYSSQSKKLRTEKKNAVLRVTASTVNAAGNTWYQLSDGNWVWSGNLTRHAHSYKGGICTEPLCGYEWKYTVTAVSGTYAVIAADGAKIWSRPYSNNSTNVRKAAYGTALTVVGKTTNKDGNLWYQLSDGTWVWSESVARQYTVTFKDNGGTGGPGTQSVISGKEVKISSKKPTRAGYTFQGWGTSKSATKVSYKAGKSYKFTSNKTLYAVWTACSHKEYSNGYCKSCGKEYALSITTYSKARIFVVTNDEGAELRNRPYAGQSSVVRTEKYKAALEITAKAVNAVGNTWYRLADGSWVWSGNLTQQFKVSYNANGGKNAPSAQTFLSGKTLTLSKQKPTRDYYIFQGWATSKSATKVGYKPGGTYSAKKSMTLYAVWKACAHEKYDSGYCTVCGKEHEAKITVYSTPRTYGVSSKTAKIWSRPYSTKSTLVRTEKKLASLSVTGMVINAAGNSWYQLSDGNWVWSGNVTRQYTITYNANGGKNAPSAQTFLKNADPTLSTKKPTRDGYVFQGWTTTKNSSKVVYNPGGTYYENKDLVLYAVWSKCTHSYSYGICKKCKYEFPLDYKEVTEAVYKVNDSDGAKSYKRPYSKSSEKKTTYKKNDVVVVTHKAVNQNGASWYLLKDGTWMKTSDLDKQTTFNSFNAVTNGYYNTLAKGTISAKQISGKWYYIFTQTSKTAYLPVTVFTGQSDNTARLSKISDKLTSAVNEHKSDTQTFLYHENSVETKVDMALRETYDVYHWHMHKLTAHAGTMSQVAIATRCTYDGGVRFTFDPRIQKSPGSLNGTLLPGDYVKALSRTTSAKATLYPQFTTAVTKSAGEYDQSTNAYQFSGYFTYYEMTGQGYAKKTLGLSDYVDLFTSAVSLTDAALAFVMPEVAIPKALYSLATDAWSFGTTVNGYTSSAPYSSKLIDLSDVGQLVYKTKIMSPIRMQQSGDYIQTQYHLYRWTEGQLFDIDFTIK